ncbi:hypothetical protein ACWKT5_19975 [Streptomyces avermitilis]
MAAAPLRGPGDAAPDAPARCVGEPLSEPPSEGTPERAPLWRPPAGAVRRSGTAAGAVRRWTAAAGGVAGSAEVSARAGVSARTGGRGCGKAGAGDCPAPPRWEARGPFPAVRRATDGVLPPSAGLVPVGASGVTPSEAGAVEDRAVTARCTGEPPTVSGPGAGTVGPPTAPCPLPGTPAPAVRAASEAAAGEETAR